MQRIRIRITGLAAFAAIAVAAACGGVSIASASAGAQTASAAAQVKAAEAAIAPYEKTPTSIGPTQPLKKRVTGKVFDFVSDGLPFDLELETYVSQATKALGDKLVVINQRGDTPQAVQTAWNQIVAKPPTVVLVPGDPTALYQPQLKALRAKHVPVVTFFTNEDPRLAANIYGPPQYKQLGEVEANYIIAKSHGKAHVLVVAVPQIPGLQGTTSALLAQLKSACSGCTAATVDTQLSDIGSNDPSTVVSYVQKNPSINWIVYVDADEQIGVPQALAGAGIHGINQMSGGGGKVNYSYIKSGLSRVDASQPASFSGWALVDTAARVLAGQPTHAWFFPLEFLTKSNLTFNINGPWPDVPNFRQKFEALWAGKK